MIKCKECGKDISNTASVCPHCGHANVAIKKKNSGCLKVGAIGGLILLVFYLIGNNASSDITSSTDLDSNTVQKVVSSEIVAVKKPEDSARLKQLSGLFTEKKDEFENVKWVKPKAKPQYINQNGAYLYFSTVNENASNLRFVIQYAAEDWLFVKSVKFIVDGQNFDYYSSRWETDHDGGIWEWSDEPARDNSLLIEAIANAKSVKYRLNGTTYYKDKTLSPAYIKSIKNTLEYYKLKNGKL